MVQSIARYAALTIAASLATIIPEMLFMHESAAKEGKRDLPPIQQEVPYYNSEDGVERLGQKTLTVVYEQNDRWYLAECGRYMFEELFMKGLPQFTTDEKARIMARIDRVEFREAKGDEAKVKYSSFNLFHYNFQEHKVEKVLLVEFKRDEKKKTTKEEYCGYQKTVVDALKMFEEWARKKQEKKPAATSADSVTAPAPAKLPTQEEIDAKTVRSLSTKLDSLFRGDSLKAPGSNCTGTGADTKGAI